MVEEATSDIRVGVRRHGSGGNGVGVGVVSGSFMSGAACEFVVPCLLKRICGKNLLSRLSFPDPAGIRKATDNSSLSRA